MPENQAKAFTDQIKKACQEKGIWVKYEEVHKNGLDEIHLGLSIKVAK